MPHTIKWLSWCADTFERAGGLNQPILMYLTAPWCHWCSIMETTTFQDDQVQQWLKHKFVCMRVNVDQYPHVADRYHFGGYPSVIILTAEGEILQGENYLSGREMISFLEESFRKHGKHACHNSSRFHAQANALQDKHQGRDEADRTSAIQPSLSLRKINQILDRSYDQEFGGFFIDDGEIKFPLPEIYDYLLSFGMGYSNAQEVVMVRKTLDQMLAGELYDRENGGFFRFCERKDWTHAHQEKLLESNAGLLSCYLKAIDIYGWESYKGAVFQTLNYLMTDFWDEETGLFGGSRRENHLDRIPYTNWNSLMASVLIRAGRIFNYPRYLKLGLQVLDLLWTRCYRFGQGMSHFCAPETSAPALLTDQTQYMLALLDAYQYTGEKTYLKRAGLLMGQMEENYRMPAGNYGDIPIMDSKPGYLKIPLIPFMENMDVVLLFMRLAHLTEIDLYKVRGENLLHILGPMHHDNPIFVAKYGLGLLELGRFNADQNLIDVCEH